jgi:hypothetical protein
LKKSLARMREIAPMVTICMHGSPLSRWERRLLLQKYNYHDFGITGEPYFDVDFLQVLYLTHIAAFGSEFNKNQFKIMFFRGKSGG